MRIELWKIVLLVSIASVRGTIDVNLSELEYLAARLDLVECRRLVAALHYHSYELPESLKDAENNIHKEIPCLRLLLHWNSAASEGLGETHELLERRLRQLGHSNLADWLGKTTFRELGKDLRRSINEPFPEVTSISNDGETTYKKIDYDKMTLLEEIDDDWSDKDFWWTIEVLMIGLLCVLLFTLILVAGCLVIDRYAWCDVNEDISVENRKLVSIN